MLGLGLRQLQEALNRRADEIQREFLQLTEEMEKLNAELLELEGEARRSHLAKKRQIRDRQHEVAEEINRWRERARSVTQTRGGPSLRALLEELKALEVDPVTEAVERTERILDAPDEALDELSYETQPEEEETAVGRLLERGRTEYDLRVGDSSARMRAAAEFANRPGIAQDDTNLTEIEGALEDADPLVRELATMTFIQLHRFRAMRFADLDLAHDSVQRLARMQSPQVVPVLAEILQSDRSGFTRPEGADEPIESTNTRSRMVALLRLVEWHTPAARVAIRNVQFDKEGEISRAAKHALEVFPQPWSGPLKRGQSQGQSKPTVD